MRYELAPFAARLPGPEDLGHLPLCSFGPGGSYVLDWQILEEDTTDRRRVFPPRTLGGFLQRLVSFLACDLKGWLIADHPGRNYRMDSHPETLEPCASCGYQTEWPNWWVQGYSEPVAIQKTGLKKFSVRTEPKEIGNLEVLAPAPAPVPQSVPEPELTEPERQPVKACTEDTLHAVTLDDEDTGYWPYLFRSSKDLEIVQNFRTSSAGALLARLAGSVANHRDLTQDSEPIENVQEVTRTITEQHYDTDPQTTQNSDHHPGLPRAERVLANHAGTGRSARCLQGNHLRTRRSTRAQRADTPDPQQGSLFGNCADGQAA